MTLEQIDNLQVGDLLVSQYPAGSKTAIIIKIEPHFVSTLGSIITVLLTSLEFGQWVFRRTTLTLSMKYNMVPAPGLGVVYE